MEVTRTAWKAQRDILHSVLNACTSLRAASREQDFMTEMMNEQSNISQKGKPEDFEESNQQPEEESAGCETKLLESILPIGWVKPVANSVTASQYLTKLLTEVAVKDLATLEQLRVLAVIGDLLNTIQRE